MHLALITTTPVPRPDWMRLGWPIKYRRESNRRCKVSKVVVLVFGPICQIIEEYQA